MPHINHPIVAVCKITVTNTEKLDHGDLALVIDLSPSVDLLGVVIATVSVNREVGNFFRGFAYGNCESVEPKDEPQRNHCD